MASRLRHFFYLALVLLPCPQMALASFAFFVLRDSRATTADYVWLFAPLALVLARLVSVGCLFTRSPKD